MDQAILPKLFEWAF